MSKPENSNPLVAIGLPVYNGGLYLRECLQSVLNQTYQNWICVIIDNKSTDDTNEIARDFVSRDKRFELIVNEEFVDQTTNWNLAYLKSRADAKYFKIVCADDWLFPAYLEKMVPVLEGDPTVGFCSSYRIDGESVRCDCLDYYDGNYYDGKQILIRQLQNKIDVTGSAHTILFRKEILKKLDYYPELFQPGVYHLDTILAYDILSISNLGFVFDVLSYTRRHNETYTSQISDRFKSGHYLKELELSKFIDLDPSFKKLYNSYRLDYAYFLLTNKIMNNKECLSWHKKYLERKITMTEYVKAVITRNFFSRKLINLYRS